MGVIEKVIEEGVEEVVYKQDNGEITAWLTNFEEKMELGHEGAQKYKNVFHGVVLISVIYFALLFLLL